MSNSITQDIRSAVANLSNRSKHLPHQLFETGYLRIPQKFGDLNADPPIPAMIPVGRSTWWAGVRSGRFPKPVKLGPRTTAWRVEDIRAWIEQTGQ